jgi:hypothetical protein
MRASAAMQLARPTASADRGRFLLVAVASAAAGGLLMAAAHVLRTDVGALYLYWSDSGIRLGVLTGAALLAIPVFAFAVQALRVGSIARDRRMAALRLAGATPRDVRLVAAAEAGAATFAGGVFAIWLFTLLWLALGVLPPNDLELMTAPDLLDAAVWIVVVVLLAVAGALAGAAVQSRVVAEPLGVFRRARAGRPGRVRFLVISAGFVLIVVTAAATFSGRIDSTLGALGIIAGFIVSATGAGTMLVLFVARRLQRGPRAEDLLAGWRLEAAPQAAGRVAVVLLLCGVAIGVELVYEPVWFYGETILVLTQLSSDDPGTYLIALAGMATLIALGIAVLTLIVGLADELVDSRRSLASLAAVGVEERVLARMLRRQLSAVALPSVLIGVGVTALGVAIVTSRFAMGPLAAATAVALGLAWLTVTLAIRLAMWVLRSRLRAAIQPENLRVA